MHSSENNFKTTVPDVRSFVSAASGVFQKLSNAHLLINFSSNIRKIHIFTNEKHFLASQDLKSSRNPKIIGH
jgi:hypothetical protein